MQSYPASCHFHLLRPKYSHPQIRMCLDCTLIFMKLTTNVNNGVTAHKTRGSAPSDNFIKTYLKYTRTVIAQSV
jgi:hypothetical protein